MEMREAPKLHIVITEFRFVYTSPSIQSKSDTHSVVSIVNF